MDDSKYCCFQYLWSSPNLVSSIDLAMFGRELSWAPQEGKVPEPWVGYGRTITDANTIGS